MNTFKDWYTSGEIKLLRGKFRSLPEVKEYLLSLDTKLSSLNIPMNLRDIYKRKMIDNFVSKRL